MSVLVVVALAAATATAVVVPTPVLGGAFWMLAAIALVAVLVPIRFVHDDQTQAFVLESGVVVALLLSGYAAVAPLLMVAASVVAHGLRSRDPGKTAFNAARSGIETVVAATTYLLLVPPGAGAADGRALLGVLVAVVVLEVASVLLTIELVARLGGGSRRAALRDVTGLWTVNIAGNIGYGILLAAVLTVELWMGGLAGALMLVTYLGYRGYAAALGGERRARALNEVTHKLIDLPTGTDGVGDVLQRLVEIFGGDRGELVVELGTDPVRWEVADGRIHTRRLDAIPRSGVLAAATARGHGIVEQADGDPPAVAVAAPILRHGAHVGGVAVSGRRGLEPWGESDANLLAAIANELAVALDNVDLLDQVKEERGRLEAESTKLNNILDAATDGIVSILADGTIDSWNPGMTQITGVEPGDAIGQPWYAVLRLRDGADQALAPSTDLLGSHARAEHLGTSLSYRVLRTDGQWRHLQCTVSPVQGADGGTRGIVLVARDVTAEREVDDLKSEFIATVSHELRTPLTPLKGFLSTLQNAGASLSQQQLQTAFRSMESQLARLEGLIADLLAVAELDRGQLDLHVGPVQLAPLVPHAVDGEARQQRERCTVNVQDVVAQADAVAVVRVVRSLVSNALKHTDGPVHVDVGVDGEWATIEVRDEGPGIPQWSQQRIFGRFDRLGHHLQRTQGPGLGLTIAQSLARRMGGDIVLVSELGVGSTFTLRVPVARPRFAASPATSTAER